VNTSKNNENLNASNKEQFLMEEYKTAVQVTYHIDELRNRLTNFFLTFAGLAVAGLATLLRGEAANASFGQPEGVVAILLMLVALIGVVIVCILARLRKVQIEYFRIINSIREHFLQTDYHLWNVVQLSAKTLPRPNRKSGTYFWLLIIMLASSSMLAAAVYIFVVHAFKVVSPEWGYVIFSATIIIGMMVEDRLYFSMASPPPPLVYSQAHPPFDTTVSAENSDDKKPAQESQVT
jgi:hypothetical protein